MTKSKQPQITVKTVYNGKQTSQQVFIDLILKKHQEKKVIENRLEKVYSSCKVFSDVRVERKEKII